MQLSILDALAATVHVALQCQLGGAAALGFASRRWGLAVGASLLAAYALRVPDRLCRLCCGPTAVSAWRRAFLWEQARRWGGVREVLVAEGGAAAFPAASEPCLYACHPHGILALAGPMHFAAGDFEGRLLPGVARRRRCLPARLAVVPAAFRMPVCCELARLSGCVPATQDDMRAALVGEGASVAVFPGGAHEALLAGKPDCRGIVRIVVPDGFLRLARDAGVPVVPCFASGELDALQAVAPLPGVAAEAVRRATGFVPLWPLGARFCGMPTLTPRRGTPRVLVVGTALRLAPDDTVLDCRAKYSVELRRVFAAAQALNPTPSEQGLEIVPLGPASRL